MRQRLINSVRLAPVLFLIILFSTLLTQSIMAEPVTIRLLYRGGGARTDVANEWIAEFERLNPDIKVQWELAPTDWQAKLLVSMSAGTAPDVVEFWGNFAQQLGRSDALLDLRPYVAKSFTKADVADFFPASWQASFMQFGEHKGEQFALPRYINTMVTYYNQTLLDQAGLESPRSLDQRGAWTWQTLRDTAAKLTKRTGDKITQQGFMTMTRQWDRMSQWLWEAGGDWFNPQDPTQFIGDRPEAQYAVDFLYKMIWEDQIARNDLSWNAFWYQQVAMADEGLNVVFSRYDASIKDGFQWDLAMRANGPNGRKPWATDDGMGIWSGTKHPEEAWRFLQFVTSRVGQEIMVKHEGLAPVRRSATAAYLDLNKRFNLNVFVESMMFAHLGITNRVAGDIDKIAATLATVLRDALVNNRKHYSVGILEVKPVIEAIMRETAK